MPTTTYPIGFWNYVSADLQGPEAARDWADCGMTAAMGPGYAPASPKAKANMHAIMQECASRGIQVIHCHNDLDWRGMTRLGPDGYRRRAAVAIEEFGRYPSLMGFHVGDEPDLFMKTDYPDVVASFRCLNELAPKHRHFSNFLPWWQGIEKEIHCPEPTYEQHLESYVREGGIRQLCYDFYAQMRPDQIGWEAYFRNLHIYRTLATKLGIPCWTTMLAAAHYDYREPSEHEFRWQLHSAAAHGMQGVLWFRLYHLKGGDDYHGLPIDEHGERSHIYAFLSRVNRTFNATIGPRLAILTHQGSWHVGRSWGGWPVFKRPDELVHAVLAESPFVYARFTDPKGAPYIAFQNNSPEKAVAALIRVDKRVKSLFRVVWDGAEQEEGFRARHAEFSELTKWFMPGQLELYRVEVSS